ncbi:MAG: flagellar hook capping FlgD N-terminal domain-containing protein [Bacillota bacterium]|nr:flagellar hook capping FlgD N-terminal domain-containing protein [Bacillota bacterium]
MAEISGVSSSSTDAYSQNTYSVGQNDKNTLNIQSYFKLLAAQLANQDMTSPMSNSELMAQMSQMAMVQSLTAMTDSVNSQIAFSKQTYGLSMIGKQVTVTIPGDELTGTQASSKTGIVESINLSGDDPTIKLKGDITDYKLSDVSIISDGSSNN